MHPLVHAWARDRLSEDLRQHYRATASYTLSSAIPWTFHTSDYRLRRMLVPHIDSCLESCQSTSAILRYSDDHQVEMARKFSLAFAENGRLRGSMELTCCGLDCREGCCVEGVKKLESPRTLMK